MGLHLPTGLKTNQTARLPGDYSVQTTHPQRGGRTHGATNKMNKTECIMASELDILKAAGKPAR